MYFSSQILMHSSGDFDDIMLTDVYIFYIFVYTYTCNDDMRSVMLQINEYDDDTMTMTMVIIWYYLLFARKLSKVAGDLI